MRWVLEKRMAQHKFFSKVTLTLDTSVPPYMIFVQKPSFEDPNYAPSVVQLFAPYLTKVAAIFDERVAKPSGAVRRADHPLTPIVILASPGDFDNYYRLGGPRDSLTSGADYDPKLDIVVFAVPEGTAEGMPFSRAHLDDLLELAAVGIAEIQTLQLRACADGR